MLRLLLSVAFSGSIDALKFRDPEAGWISFDRDPVGFDAVEVTAKGCGVVQYAFGAEKYIKYGLQASKYVRSLQVDKGWCAQDPELDHIPVTLFTDHEAGTKLFTNATELVGFGSEYEGVNVVVLRQPSLEEFNAVKCGPGVECRPEEDLPPYPAKDQKVKSVAGSWKFRWYHAQVLLQSPYILTFYLDVDAVPCSGAGFTQLVKRMEDTHSDVGSTIHRRCSMTPGSKSCAAMAPEGASKSDWKKYSERNDGVVAAMMHEGGVGRKIMSDFAKDIVRFAGAASGDQYAFRRAMFNHRHEMKELVYSNNEVCRYQGKGHMIHGDGCKKGCQGIAHEVNGGAMGHIPKDIPLPKDMPEASSQQSMPE